MLNTVQETQTFSCRDERKVFNSINILKKQKRKSNISRLYFFNMLMMALQDFCSFFFNYYFYFFYSFSQLQEASLSFTSFMSVMSHEINGYDQRVGEERSCFRIICLCPCQMLLLSDLRCTITPLQPDFL